MFGSSMENRVGCQVCGSNVITPKLWRRRELNTKIPEKILNP